MTTTSHYASFLQRTALLTPPIALCFGALIWHRGHLLPDAPEGVGELTVPERQWPSVAGLFAGVDWKSITHRGGGIAPGSVGSLARRFRLAGTFVVFGGGEDDDRRAILDDSTARGAQVIVAEDDAIGDVLVVGIFRERVVLRGPQGEETLWLSFAKPSGGTNTTNVTAADGATDVEADGTAGFNDFGGKQVGPNRWVFRREALMDYYQELMNEPERLIRVFDSLKPVYDGDANRIGGYRLGVEGEGEFFDAAGLREGDVVRSVNQMAMTNRRRAEYFIKEFVKGRATAFVLEVERDGTRDKLIYQVR